MILIHSDLRSKGIHIVLLLPGGTSKCDVRHTGNAQASPLTWWAPICHAWEKGCLFLPSRYREGSPATLPV